MKSLSRRLLSIQYWVCILLCLISTVSTQSSTTAGSDTTSSLAASAASTGGTIDDSLVTRWNSSINFEGCFSDLKRADRDGNGVVKREEYLNFVQEYGKRLCFKTNKLTLQQEGVFNSLACLCRNMPGTTSDCCFDDNAQIPTAGATNPKTRTPREKDYLVSVCKLTDATIDSRCPPIIKDRDPPIVPVLPGTGLLAVPASSGGNDGLPWWVWLLIALAALLLFCLGCCCLWKKRQAKQDEEEEEIQFDVAEIIANDKLASSSSPRDIDPEQPLERTEPAYNDTSSDPENVRNEEYPYSLPSKDPVPPETVPEPVVPADVPPAIGAAMSRGAVVGDDSDDEEDVRKRFGGDRIPPEPEEEKVIIRGAPPFPLPDPTPAPPRPLKPIPDKEKECDEWDQPGRNIEYPVEKDDDSAQEIEPYVPDGGVYFPERPKGAPVDWNREWNRARPEEPDDIDTRKHRIQTGLGEGAVWDKLGEESNHVTKPTNNGGDGFDWVIQSALGALDDGGRDPSSHDKTTSSHAPFGRASTTATPWDRINETDDEGEIA